MHHLVNLKSIIEESKDGEWGKSEPFPDSVEMAVIRGTDFNDVRVGSVNSLPRRFIPKHIADKKALRSNDILIETAGGSGNRPTGRTLFITDSIIRRSPLPLVCASFSRFIRINPEKANSNFVYWCLQNKFAQGIMWQYNTRHSGIARFQYTVFSENEIFTLPDLRIQQFIACTLSTYDDLIENNTRRIQILEEMAQAIYREWFVNFRYPGHEGVRLVESPLGLIPEGWEVTTIREVTGYINRGISPKYNDSSDKWVINQKCIRNSRISLELARRHSSTVSSDKYIKFGDVLVNSTGVGTLGRVAQIYQELDEYTVDSHVSIVRPNSKVGVDYFGFFMMSLQEYFDHMGTGATNQTELGREIIAKTPFLLPPLLLQSDFRETVQPLRRFVGNLQKKNENLRQQRDLLLPRLISGELEVENLEIAS